MKKILFSGGGTLGPVMPLLAIADELRKKNPEVALTFVGTHEGVEEAYVRAHKLPFQSMVSAKLHRFGTIKNLAQPFYFVVSLWQAFRIIQKEKPDLLITAGGYVSVPLHYAARTLKIPTMVHVQDSDVGLANKLMLPFASAVSCTFQETAELLKKYNPHHTGNPIRPILFQGDKDRAVARFHLDPDRKTVLIFGGGTGALRLNLMVAEIAPTLTKEFQILHITGTGKNTAVPRFTMQQEEQKKHYHVFEFLMDEEMADAYKVADVVVARAGLSSISEIASLQKAAILVPMPDSHQEFNAQYVAHKEATEICEEFEGHHELEKQITKLMTNEHTRRELSHNGEKVNSPTANENVRGVIMDLLNKKSTA